MSALSRGFTPTIMCYWKTTLEKQGIVTKLPPCHVPARSSLVTFINSAEGGLSCQSQGHIWRQISIHTGVN